MASRARARAPRATAATRASDIAAMFERAARERATRAARERATGRWKCSKNQRELVARATSVGVREAVAARAVESVFEAVRRARERGAGGDRG